MLTPGPGLQLERLRARMVQAGFYGTLAVQIFQAIKLLSAVTVALVLPTVPGVAGLLPAQQLLWFALGGLAVGWLLPGFWVDSKS